MPSTGSIQSTQKFLNILAIRDGVIILRDGGLRLILKVGSLNFALKSEEEQEGMIGQYQSFINSLKFPIQIVMQSRRLDLYNYLRYLKGALERQTNEMVRLQTEDYINYIEKLIAKANIMDKHFYVVVPLFPSGVQRAGLLDRLLGGVKTNDVHFTSDQFKAFKEQVMERAEVVIGGLGGLGLKVNILNTQEIVELFYSLYNPEEAISERLTEVHGLEVPVVGSQSGVMGAERENSTIKSDEGSNQESVAEEKPETKAELTGEPTAGQPQEPPVSAVPTPIVTPVTALPPQEVVAMVPPVSPPLATVTESTVASPNNAPQES